MTQGNELHAQLMRAREYELRTVVPGRVQSAVDAVETGLREVNATFEVGIPDLIAGQAGDTTVQPDAPVMNLTSGGFFCLMPTSPDDEMLGLCADRSIGPWRQSRAVGSVDVINGKRSKKLSDIMLTPFAITAPTGAPEQWDGLVLGGPSGVALQVDSNGVVTITKRSATGGAPTPVATVALESGGSVTIDVVDGQSVNVGGALAVALTKWQALSTAMTAMLEAGAFAGTGAPGTTGKLAFEAAKEAWDIAIGLNPPATMKAKGE